MPDPTPAAPAIDYDKLGAAVAASLGTALADSNKLIAEALGKLAPLAATSPAAGATATPAATASKPLTAEDVSKLVGDALKQFSTQQQAASARESFISSKMNDLPPLYRNAMPQTGDAAELAKAEQAIRTQYQADFKTAGGTTPPVAGGGSGTPPAGAGAPVDMSKMSPTDLVVLGMKSDVPQRQQQPANG